MHPFRLSGKRGRKAHNNFALVAQLVLPDPQNKPARSAQFAVDLPIPRLISCELLSPVLLVRPRQSRVFETSVPEAPVHKHGNPLFSETEIRFSKQRLISPPAAYPI
jgi:hypothetical protein